MGNNTSTSLPVRTARGYTCAKTIFDMQKISKKLYASFHLKSFLLLSQNYNNTKVRLCQYVFFDFRFSAAKILAYLRNTLSL